ncbi:MFS transporter [Nonomuraea sp. NPDC050328]|uniref:MFS transporter n=1 Tax=Nonomuraea sp. NPDC050328 TaxID=3364361 RepID=UPI0037A18FDC
MRPAVLAVYVTAMCMNGLDATIVNPALFRIAADLGVAPAAANPVEWAFLASVAAVMPVAGWLCDRYGAARVFLVSLAVFTAGSGLCALAWDLGSLVGFRVVQGAGGGVLTPAGLAMLFAAVPPEERMRLSKYVVVPTALAPALGPVLGGWLADAFSWRWAFLVNLPLGAAAVVAGLVVLPLSGGTTVRLVLRELLPVRQLAADQAFLRGTAAAALAAAGLMGMLFVFPLMYQDLLGASATEAGLVLFPEALGLLAAGFLVERSCARWGERRVIAVGLAGGAVLFALPALADLGPWPLRLLMFAVGLVLGQAVTAVQVTSFAGVGPELMGRAMTLFQSVRMLGGGLGVGLCALAIGLGYRAALLVSAALVAAALTARAGAHAVSETRHP